VRNTRGRHRTVQQAGSPQCSEPVKVGGEIDRLKSSTASARYGERRGRTATPALPTKNIRACRGVMQRGAEPGEAVEVSRLSGTSWQLRRPSGYRHRVIPARFVRATQRYARLLCKRRRRGGVAGCRRAPVTRAMREERGRVISRSSIVVPESIVRPSHAGTHTLCVGDWYDKVGGCFESHQRRPVVLWVPRLRGTKSVVGLTRSARADNCRGCGSTGFWWGGGRIGAGTLKQ